jgi:hypothetical protein
MSLPLTWVETTRDLGAGGRAFERRASAAERAALAETLGLVAVGSLTFAGRVRPLDDGRIGLEARLLADVTQTCVVTLEPIIAHVDEEIDLELWPAAMLTQRQLDGEQAILGGEDPEALTALGEAETGRIAFEVLSAALDPYPRKSGAEVDWKDPTDDPATSSPFAVLSRLKDPD